MNKTWDEQKDRSRKVKRIKDTIEYLTDIQKLEYYDLYKCNWK